MAGFAAQPSSNIGSDPAQHAAAVTPSDTTDLPSPCRALYVGAGGNVAVDTYGGETNVVFTAVPTGMILPVACRRVRSTLTTASAIVALS